MSIYVDLDLFNPAAEVKEKKCCHEKHNDAKYPDVKCCEEKELANAYIPFQKINKVYSPDEGLAAGTIFPELNKPYVKKCYK